VATPARAFADDLDDRLRAIGERIPNGVVGVSVYDYLSGRSWTFNGDRWFHAASVIKVPVLVTLFAAVDQGRFALNARLLVRNRFLSVVDGAPFRVDPGRDGDSEVHAALGRTMRLRELAHHMIVRSSNLATNLLVDLIGVPGIRRALGELGIQGVDVCRGVEDQRAFDQGINNRITPNGAVALLRAIVAAEAISPESSTRMLTILTQQQFAGTIAPGLPEPIRSAARVAHKTGDISTASHDAGVVFLPGRPPYLVGIFVESAGDSRERTDAGIAASTAVYGVVAAAGEGMLR
jgi:beta-lactamase class A